MSFSKTRKLTMGACLMALCLLFTMAVRIPSPMGGYLNLGDCAVLLAAWLLGPVEGAVCAGFGSVLADLLGYPLYAPATLLIKGCMALVAGGLFRLWNHRSSASLWLSGAAAELCMVIGYFVFESLVLGLGLGALGNVPANLIQGTLGLITARMIMLSNPGRLLA